MRRWIGRGLLCLLVAAIIALVFRQGLVPARYTPLPRLDLANPLPLVVDWQLAELRYDRRLCRETMQSVELIRARPIGDRPLKNGCGWINAVRVSRLGDVVFPAGRLSCQVAAALALWIEYDVQPIAEELFGQEVKAMTNFGTYSCRNIIGSRIWSGRRSEHATANAVDISAFRLANGERISVLRHWRKPGKKSEFLRRVHARACRYFRVSLSPEFNAAHRDHFHFDRGFLSTCK